MLWSCFGYVWIGGGTMLLALIDSAGWWKTGTGPISGIVIGLYAAMFGWLTWKQSFVGTIIGFILYGLLIFAGVVVSINEGDFPTVFRGWWAVVGQSMLLLNGVRAARYKRRPSTASDVAKEPAEVGETSPSVPLQNYSSIAPIGIRYCSS